MKNILLFFCFMAFDFAMQAQDDLDIFEKPTKQGIDLYGANDGLVPLTLEIDFNQLKNLRSDVKLPHQVVIPVGGSAQRLLGLTVIDPQRSPEYDFRFNYIPGDVNASHKDDFIYWLPFNDGSSYVLHQGYHGDYSHRNIYALDFNLPEGTEVRAARGGIVSDAKEDSDSGCNNPSCQGKSNYVVIAHDDGSFSNYVHLQHNGVLVNVGEQVKQGQLIAISGNTGWSSGAHLHFEVYTRGLKKNRSLPTQFLTKEHNNVRLSEGKTYTSHHPKN